MAAARRAITRAGHVVVEMGSSPASPVSREQVCRQQLGTCDVYLAVIGFKYGTLVPGHEVTSFTELEFNTATALDLPRLMFVLDANAELPLPRTALVDQQYADRQDAFRARVEECGVTRAVTTSPQQLETLLYQALIELAAQSPEGASADASEADTISAATRGWPRITAMSGHEPGHGFVGREEYLHDLHEVLGVRIERDRGRHRSGRCG